MKDPLRTNTAICQTPLSLFVPICIPSQCGKGRVCSTHSSMRPLILHASALSDGEYDFYTASLYDITTYEPSNDDGTVVHEDVHFEQMSVGIREVRAWLRGRYSHIP